MVIAFLNEFSSKKIVEMELVNRCKQDRPSSFTVSAFFPLDGINFLLKISGEF